MQNYERLYWYIEDYQNLIYKYYSKHAIAYLTTYYHLNDTTTVWDDSLVLGGSYERVGDLSGTKWDKLLTLPVYFTEEINTQFDGQETGYNKETQTTFVIPSEYGFTPLPGDMVKFESSFLMQGTNDTYPVYVISGVEKSANTKLTFWKLTAKVFQSRNQDELELQTSNTYMFYDYDKNIHELTDAALMTRLLSKQEELKDKLHSKWDSNSGFYFPLK